VTTPNIPVGELNRIEDLEAVVALLRADIAEAYRRISNNRDDNLTTADTLAETGVDRKVLATVLTTQSERLDLHKEAFDLVVSFMAKTEKHAEDTEELFGVNGKTTDHILSAIQALINRVRMLEADATEDAERLDSLEELEDIGSDMLDNLERRIGKLEYNATTDASQRLLALEAAVRKLNGDDDYTRPTAPAWPTYPTYPTYPTGPNVWYTSQNDTGYETK